MTPEHTTPPDNSHDVTVTGIFIILCASVGFGLQAVLAKLIYVQNVNVLTLLCTRTLILTPLLWILVLIKLPHHSLLPKNRLYILASMSAGFIGFYVTPLSDLTALSKIDAGIERIIFYTFPAMVILMNAKIHHSRPPLSHILAFILIQVGVFMVVRDSGNGVTPSHNLVSGSIWAFFAAFMFSIYVLLNQHITVAMGSSLIFILYAVTGSSVAITFHFFSTTAEPLAILHALSVKAIWLIIVFSLVTFLSVIAFAEGVKRIGAPRAALITMLSPVVTIILGILLLGETLTLLQWIGGTLVLGTVTMLEIKVLHIWLQYRRTQRLIRNSLEK